MLFFSQIALNTFDDLLSLEIWIRTVHPLIKNCLDQRRTADGFRLGAVIVTFVTTHWMLHNDFSFGEVLVTYLLHVYNRSRKKKVHIELEETSALTSLTKDIISSYEDMHTPPKEKYDT